MISLDCRKCTHYFITWDKNAPHGCRALAFKSRRLPGQLVLQSSGLRCFQFHPKTASTANGRRVGDRNKGRKQ